MGEGRGFAYNIYNVWAFVHRYKVGCVGNFTLKSV